MFDCHSHCNHSVDSPTPIDSMVEAAISKGMKYIAFTDHLDKDYLYGNSIDKEIKQIDLSYHIADTLRAKNKYAGSIEIACGVECGFSVQSEQDYKKLLNEYEFDLILNSVHSVNGMDCYHRQFFDGKDKHTAYKEYLLAVLDSVNAKYSYDVITHIGYVCRKAPYENKDMLYSEFGDILDKILSGIIDKGVSLELNSHNRGTDTPFLPYLSIVERYIQLGGSEFTFGSDAHRIDRVNDKFEVVRDYLLSKNQKYINIYRKRQKVKINLTKI